MCSQNPWLSDHISITHQELQDIFVAIHIYKIVDEEWDKRIFEYNIPENSEVRRILLESLVYKIVLGLGKIFANAKEYSLLKITNQIEQLQPNNDQVLKTIGTIRAKLLSSQMVKIIHEERDKLFAHLDKKNILIAHRLDPTSVMKHINSEEIQDWLTLICNLHEACYGSKLVQREPLPSKKEIIYTFFWR